MSNKLVILVNNQPRIEYDRNIRLPGHQREFLDKMDKDMDAGITLGDVQIGSPDPKERAKFVAMSLVQAILADEDPLIAATCAYLANRMPELTQVKADEVGEDIHMELIFNQEHTNQVQVDFDMSGGKSSKIH